MSRNIALTCCVPNKLDVMAMQDQPGIFRDSGHASDTGNDVDVVISAGHSGSFGANIAIKEGVPRNKTNNLKALGGCLNNGGNKVGTVLVHVDGSRGAPRLARQGDGFFISIASQHDSDVRTKL